MCELQRRLWFVNLLLLVLWQRLTGSKGLNINFLWILLTLFSSEIRISAFVIDICCALLPDI